MRSEPFFAAPPPKSTGRDLFNAAWLDRHLAGTAGPCAPADVMATLAELTARSIADSLVRFASAAAELVVCGGGAQNLHLLERLRSLLPALAVISSALRGVAPEQVEALAFAWLARAFIEREPGNVAAVTGAAGPRILGALYPA
jgi:anhydro-N-acetylmuramic acid kinase